MEISRLKAAYCEAVDGGWDRRTHNGEAVASLFVKDGVWDAGSIGGRGEGHEGIVRTINSFRRMPFAFPPRDQSRYPHQRRRGDRQMARNRLLEPARRHTGDVHGRLPRQVRENSAGMEIQASGRQRRDYTSLREGWGTGEYYKQQARPGTLRQRIERVGQNPSASCQFDREQSWNFSAGASLPATDLEVVPARF